MLTFHLEIEMGNEAMQTAEDLAACIRYVAGKMQDDHIPIAGVVRDANGNTVGHWHTEEDA